MALRTKFASDLANQDLVPSWAGRRCFEGTVLRTATSSVQAPQLKITWRGGAERGSRRKRRAD
jgi:hypothetical protein